MNFRKLKNALLFVAIIVFYSCNETNTENQKNEIKNMQKELSSKDSIIEVLTKQAFNYKKRTDSIESDLHKEYVNKNYVSFLFQENYFLLDKENIVKTLINTLELNERNIMTQLFEYGFMDNDDSEAPFYDNKIRLISFLWNETNRSSENINKLITEKDKSAIYSIFKDNTIYEDSGISTIVKGLLTAYNEIEADEESKLNFLNLKSNLYKTSSVPAENSDIYWESQRIANDLLATEEMKEILSDKNYTSYTNSQSDISNRIFYVYSFWGRRYKEGNQIIFYELLKEFHQNISKNKEENEEYNL